MLARTPGRNTRTKLPPKAATRYEHIITPKPRRDKSTNLAPSRAPRDFRHGLQLLRFPASACRRATTTGRAPFSISVPPRPPSWLLQTRTLVSERLSGKEHKQGADKKKWLGG